MNFTGISHSKKVLIAAFFSAVTVLVSCQKADPDPSSSAPVRLPNDTSNIVVIKPAFIASVNGSPNIKFNPSKSNSGGNISLIGTTTNYTVTITFPNSTGPGSFFFGSTITASIYDGFNTYYANGNYGTGSLRIDSIPAGMYYGSFSFIADDPALNTESVSGTFNDL